VLNTSYKTLHNLVYWYSLDELQNHTSDNGMMLWWNGVSDGCWTGAWKQAKDQWQWIDFSTNRSSVRSSHLQKMHVNNRSATVAVFTVTWRSNTEPERPPGDCRQHQSSLPGE